MKRDKSKDLAEKGFRSELEDLKEKGYISELEDLKKLASKDQPYRDKKLIPKGDEKKFLECNPEEFLRRYPNIPKIAGIPSPSVSPEALLRRYPELAKIPRIPSLVADADIKPKKE